MLLLSADFRLALAFIVFQSSSSLPPGQRGLPIPQLEEPQNKLSASEPPANRPDHLEAVPLERDGSINKEFRKEVLFGMSAEGEEGSKPDLPEKSSSELIKEMFKKADLNNDQRLSKDELKAQILANTNHHLEESKKESDDVFQTVDENGDGRITWDEYKSHFLVEKKLVEKEKIKEHAKNTDDLDTNSRILLDEEKNAFGQSDADNDGLNELEWLGFRHPEHSSVMLKEMAQEILKAFDRDQDGKLSLGEFSRVEGGEVTDPKMEEAYVKERQHEFAQIDVNQDGYATSEELLNYVNPRNERHANAEVSEIMDIADTNEDNFLTLKELLDKAELLATSGFIRPKERLHDDL